MNQTRTTISKKLLGEGLPDEHLTRMQRTMRYAIRLTRHCTRRSIRDRAPQMAAALAYRTIFSLIPVLVLSLVLLRAWFGNTGIQDAMNWFMEYSGLSEITVTANLDGESRAASSNAEGDAGSSGEQAMAVSAWLENFVNRASEHLSSLNYNLITLVGVLVLIYAAVSLFIQIEQAFNTVLNAPEGRRFLVRITNYWTLMTLGSIGLLASFSIGRGFNDLISQLPAWAGFATQPLRIGTKVGITWLVMLFAFLTMPTVRLPLRQAAIGAAVSAGLWEVCKGGLGYFISNLTGRQVAFYGSLALIPLLLFWIYVTWLVVLFGLELAVSLRAVRDGEVLDARQDHRRKTEFVDPSLGLIIMREIAIAFAQGSSCTVEQLADRSGVPHAVTQRIVDRFVKDGLLNRIAREDEQGAYALSRPPESIELSAIMRTLQDIAAANTHSEHQSVVNRLREQQLEALQGRSLKSLQNGAIQQSVHEQVARP